MKKVQGKTVVKKMTNFAEIELLPLNDLLSKNLTGGTYACGCVFSQSMSNMAE